MRIFRTFLFAAAISTAALAGCSPENAALKPVKTTEAQLDKLVDKLRTETFKEKAKSETDVAAAAAAMPKAIKVAYASSALDSASGATVLKDVKITPADNTAVGLSIAELKLWGLDAEFLKARLSGQRLTEQKKLASRIEANSISAFGIETLMNPALEAYTGAVTDIATDIVDENLSPEERQAIAAAANLKASKYTFTVSKMVFDEVVLRPWELTRAKPSADSPDDFEALAPLLQQYVAISRSLAFDAVAMFDMKGEIAFADSESDMSASMTGESFGYRGWRGWDADLGVIKGLSYDISIKPLPAAATATPPDATTPSSPYPTVEMKQKIARTSVANMRLDKLMGYLARWQMPPRTETNLLSLGVIRIDDLTVALGGDKPVYSIGQYSIDLSKWHWLIPAAGKFRMDNMAIDSQAVVEFAKTMGETAGAQSAELAQFDAFAKQFMPTLVKYGVDKPSFDGAFGWDWNPTSGVSSIDMELGLDNFTRFDAKLGMGLPGFQAVSDLIPETGNPNEAAIEALFGKTFAITSAEANFVDEGGFEKGFALAVELAKQIPDDPNNPSQNQGLAMLRSQTPEGLRGMAVSGAYLMADQAGKEMPALAELLRPFAAWLKDGGKVTVALKPKAPLNSEALSKLSSNPNDAIAALGLTTTHTPGAKPKPQ